MVLSFIHPTTCGFVRGIAWEISKKVDDEWKFGDSDTRTKLKQSCQITERFNRFVAVFASCKENFAIDLKGFRKILPDLRKKIAGWSRKIHERNQYTATFNTKSWKRLPAAEQVKHTFQNCQACQDHFVAVQALFPVQSIRFAPLTRSDVAPLLSVVDSSTPVRGSLSKVCSKRSAVETARAIYHRINPSFESTCNMPLSAALVQVSELDIEEKKTKGEKRKERRRLYKKSKQATEAEWAKTDVVRLAT